MKKIQEIIEGNKLIAEFVDLEVLANPHLGGVRPKLSNSTPKELLKIIFCEIAYEEGSVYPQFNTSWDWLMPVVEKIEKEHKYCVTIVLNSCKVNCMAMSNTKQITSNSLAHGSDYEGKNTKLTNTWKACIEFIRWYNENKTLI